MHYGWDLKRQGDRIEFDALAYSTAYFEKELNDIDLDFVELTLGPSFNMKRWNLDKTRAYLYAIGDFAYLGYDPYFSAPGAGFRLLSFGAAQSVLWSFLYGSEMTFTGKNGKTTTVYEPGYTLDLSSGTPTVRPTTATDTNAFMNALTKGGTGGTGTAGSDSTNPPPKQVLAETISLQDLISDATATQINDTLQKDEQTEPADTPPPENPAGHAAAREYAATGSDRNGARAEFTRKIHGVWKRLH